MAELVTIIGDIPVGGQVAKDLEGAAVGKPRFLDNGSVDFRVAYKDGGTGVVNVKGLEATAQIQFATDRGWPVKWQFVPCQGEE